MKTGDGAVTLTRTTVANYTDIYGIVKEAGIDLPRFETDGLLVEGISTNEVLYSETLDDVYWEKLDSTILTDNVISPSGLANADTIIGTDEVDENIVIRSGPIVSIVGEHVAVSAYVKAGTKTNVSIKLSGRVTGNQQLTFDMVAKEFTAIPSLATSSSFVELRDGWFRIQVVVTTDLAEDTRVVVGVYDATVVGTEEVIHVWGVQLERLPFISSYIKTLDIPVTRGADKYVVTGNNTPSGDAEKTILVDYSLLPSGTIAYSSQRVLFDTEGVQYNLLKVDVNTVDLSAYYGGNKYTVETDVTLERELTRVSYTVVKDGDNRYGVNGLITATDPSTIDSNSIPISIKLGWVSDASMLFGHIKNFKVYNKALTEDEIRIA